jgi:hypothetical protein
MNFPVPVPVDSPDSGIASVSKSDGRRQGEACEGIPEMTSLGSDPLTCQEARADSHGGEKSLNPTCEFPKPSGRGICGQPATQVVTISGFRWSYNAKACSKCADQLEKEVRVNKGRDG